MITIIINPKKYCTLFAFFSFFSSQKVIVPKPTTMVKRSAVWLLAMSFLAFLCTTSQTQPPRTQENDARSQSVQVVNEYLSGMEQIFDAPREEGHGKTREEEKEYKEYSEEDKGEEELNKEEEEGDEYGIGLMENILYIPIREYIKPYLVDGSKRVLQHMVSPFPNSDDKRPKHKDYTPMHYYQYAPVPYRMPPSSSLNQEKTPNGRNGYESSGISHHEHLFAEAIWVFISMGILLVALMCLYRCFSGTISKMIGLLYAFMSFVFFMGKLYHFYGLFNTYPDPQEM